MLEVEEPKNVISAPLPYLPACERFAKACSTAWAFTRPPTSNVVPSNVRSASASNSSVVLEQIRTLFAACVLNEGSVCSEPVPSIYSVVAPAPVNANVPLVVIGEPPILNAEGTVMRTSVTVPVPLTVAKDKLPEPSVVRACPFVPVSSGRTSV